MFTGAKRFSEDHVKTLESGSILFEEGDDSRDMFVIQDGEIEIIKKTPSGEVLLTTLRRGDFVGEMALLESLPRSASARAKGRAKLLVIQPGGFLLKIRRDPTFAFEMLQALSRRIRLTNEKLLTIMDKNEQSKGIVRDILNSLEFDRSKN
jgi:CRP-like cAMP-binding protein